MDYNNNTLPIPYFPLLLRNEPVFHSTFRIVLAFRLELEKIMMFAGMSAKHLMSLIGSEL